MKHLAYLSLLCLFLQDARCQHIGFAAQYEWIKAQSWEQAIQTYNFSRPFLEERQPLLQNGFRLSAYYMFRSLASITYGPTADFSIHRSRAENDNFDIGIQSSTFSIGPMLRYQEPGQALFISAAPKFRLGFLTRRLNGEIITIEEDEENDPLRVVVAGFGIDAQIGYQFYFGEKATLAPQLNFGFDPILSGERSPLIFNEAFTTELDTKTSVWRLGAGILIEI